MAFGPHVFGKVFSQIVKRELYKDRSCPRSARGSYHVTLACGHTAEYKASKCPLLKAFCRDCTYKRREEERARLQRKGRGD